jgi:hypothetical protein
MANGSFRLLERFRQTFYGHPYLHRDSSLGNKIGRELFEDLITHSKSARFLRDVKELRGVANRGGKIHTPKAIRRNDSIFGRPPAGVKLKPAPKGFTVMEGPVAEPLLGCEVKMISKSQLKQIDRVINDLDGFLTRMKSLNKRCINLAVVGINHESDYVGFEGKVEWRHTLRAQEPQVVAQRVREALVDKYDELLVLSFAATNQPPYPFTWLNAKKADLDYGAALTRLGIEYQRRFR